MKTENVNFIDLRHKLERCQFNGLFRDGVHYKNAGAAQAIRTVMDSAGYFLHKHRQHPCEDILNSESSQSPYGSEKNTIATGGDRSIAANLNAAVSSSPGPPRSAAKIDTSSKKDQNHTGSFSSSRTSISSRASTFNVSHAVAYPGEVYGGHASPFCLTDKVPPPPVHKRCSRTYHIYDAN